MIHIKLTGKSALVNIAKHDVNIMIIKLVNICLLLNTCIARFDNVISSIGSRILLLLQTLQHTQVNNIANNNIFSLNN